MERTDSMDDLEERADQLLNAVLELSGAEVHAIYIAAQPNDDPIERLRELSYFATMVCDTEGRERPPQIGKLLGLNWLPH